MRKFVDMTIKDVSCFGSIIFLGVVFFTAVIFQFYDLAFKIIIGQVIIYLIAGPIKFLYNKKRPNERTYNDIIEKIDASSFPSIHAARITLLSILLHFFGKNMLFTALLVIITLFVFYSRIHVKDHDVKDVIGGFITGLIAGIIAILI